MVSWDGCARLPFLFLLARPVGLLSLWRQIPFLRWVVDMFATHLGTIERPAWLAMVCARASERERSGAMGTSGGRVGMSGSRRESEAEAG